MYSAGKKSLDSWQEVLLPGAAGMGGGLLATALLSPVAVNHPILLFVSLAVTGFCGGMFLIPITSFIQMRPNDMEKGQVLATAGFCSFVGILLAGQAYYLMDLFMVPSTMMATAGAMSLALALVYSCFSSAKSRPGETVLRLAMQAIMRLRYKIEIKGLEKITSPREKGSILFLPNHPALIDPVILMTILHKPFRPRPLVDRRQTDRFYLRSLTNLVNAIRIPNAKEFKRADLKHIATALDKVVDALQQGDNVLLYPAGRLCRSRHEELGANSGVRTILSRIPRQRIVLVRTSGLWGSSFSWASGQTPSPLGNWRSAICFFLANGLLFGPRRKLAVEFVEPASFPRNADKLTINRVLEKFYNEVSKPNTTVPLYWWLGNKEFLKSEPSGHGQDTALENIPRSIKEEVLKHIAGIAGVEAVAVKDNLARDIGMDSLAIMDLAAWLENEYGLQLNNIESLRTAGDCVLAACRQSGGTGRESLNGVHHNQPHPAQQTRRTGDGLLIAGRHMDMSGRAPRENFSACQSNGPLQILPAMVGVEKSKNQQDGGRSFHQRLGIFAQGGSPESCQHTC
jgi:1-acyl-sn-glycerol-3-phosphate acyltransferase/acyl carrier protein